VDVRARVEQLPQLWRGRLPLELVEASLDPAAPSTPPPGTRWMKVPLRYRYKGTKVCGRRAMTVEGFPEFFALLGWTAAHVLDTTYHMFPPETGAGSDPPAEVLVPRPEEDQLVALAYERAEAAIPWQGAAWLWPAKYTPPVISRTWEDRSFLVWDGRDENGDRTGGGCEQPAGWRDTSSPATFEIGVRGLWYFKICWGAGQIIVHEDSGREHHTRQLAFAPATRVS
jgi:hypothetical protein